MRFGIHLPQFGRAAGAEAIGRAARQAEDLGFDDIWVSDHLAVPAGESYVPAHFYEPIVALTYAAALTRRVGLGTTVLILPYRHPLHLAKELATLDALAGGRLLVGAGVGWLEAEFEALGVPFQERGERTDEALAALRACWEQDPVQFSGRRVQLHDLRVLPHPPRRIPIWIGGQSQAALKRATQLGDGWHGTFMTPEQAAPLLAQLRSQRPDPAFTLSMRVAWDGLRNPPDELRRGIEAFRREGVQHLLASPMQADTDGWLRSVEALWKLFEPERG